MQSSLIPGKLKVFESDGYFCASFVSPGYPMLAARDDDFVELAEWLLDIGVAEDVFEGNALMLRRWRGAATVAGAAAPQS